MVQAASVRGSALNLAKTCLIGLRSWACYQVSGRLPPRGIPESAGTPFTMANSFWEVCQVGSGSASFRRRRGRSAQPGTAIARSRSDPVSLEPIDGWRGPQFMMAARARMRPGPAAPGCKSCATGFSASTPRARWSLEPQGAGRSKQSRRPPAPGVANKTAIIPGPVENLGSG